MGDGPTRTPATVTRYLNRAGQILKQIERDLRISDDRGWTIEDLPRYLDRRRRDLAPASWRQYKAALLQFVGSEAAGRSDWLRVLAQLEGLRWSATAQTQPRPLRTSARKIKSPPAGDLARLRDQLSFSDPLAADFFRAALLTGLRPSEWPGAEIESAGDGWRLRARNAKHTNGRAHGEMRTLLFDHLELADLLAIRRMIATFRKAAAADSVDALKERIERGFRAANNALWPRRRKAITPYTLRHVFASRIKKSRSAGDIAALMGHASDQTAHTHYARRSRTEEPDYGRRLPKAEPAEAKTVRSEHAEATARLARIKHDAARAASLDDVGTQSPFLFTPHPSSGPTKQWRR